MAIFTPGPLITGIRGTVGGLTFSQNKSGPFVRAWSTPGNPRTAPQQIARGALGSLGYLWQSLTPAQRTAWGILALADPEPKYNSLGELVNQSGWNYFVKLNTRRARLALAPLDDAPTGSEATRPSAKTLDNFTVDSAGSGEFSGDWDNTSDPTGGYGIVTCSVYPSAARQYVPVRNYWVLAAPVATASFDNYPAFEAIFGQAIPNYAALGIFHIQNLSGLRSIGETISTIIA